MIGSSPDVEVGRSEWRPEVDVDDHFMPRDVVGRIHAYRQRKLYEEGGPIQPPAHPHEVECPVLRVCVFRMRTGNRPDQVVVSLAKDASAVSHQTIDAIRASVLWQLFNQWLVVWVVEP